MLTWAEQYDGGISITRGEFVVSAAFAMDLFVIIFIRKKQLGIVIGSSVLREAGMSILGHYTVKHMLCSNFLLVLVVCCSPHPICFRSQNKVFCRFIN